MHIVKEIQACIQLLPEVKFRKVRREYSALAHELAQLAKRTRGRHIMLYGEARLHLV